MVGNPKACVEEINPQPETAGVVDIGSNGIRLLIGHINSSGEIQITLKKREAIRLGGDVFSRNLISPQSINKVTMALSQFSEEFKKNQVHKVRAVATSAVREAHNKDDFVSHIKEVTGIPIHVIDGEQESQFILMAVSNALRKRKSNLLIMDIGGGSVEFILSSNGSMAKALSLPLGTVRMLKNVPPLSESYRERLDSAYESSLEPVKNFLKESPKEITFAGTGGNLECLGHLRQNFFKKILNTKIKSHELNTLVDELFRLNSDQRMQQFHFKKDRSDVILPASLLTQKMLQLTEQTKILIPKVGLREGVLISLLDNTSSIPGAKAKTLEPNSDCQSPHLPKPPSQKRSTISPA